jgi:hypothetical protein
MHDRCVGSMQTGYPAYRLKSKTRSKTYCHMPYSSGSRLTAREGSDAATCPTVLDPASLLDRAPALPRVPLHRTHLLAREGFSVVMCPMASDSTSLLGRASVLPRALRLRTVPPCSRGLQRCHVPHSSGPRLPAQEGSGAATVDLCGPQTSRIKKGLASLPMRLGSSLPMRLGSHVFKVHPHVFETSDT